MAAEKSPMRISQRLFATSRSEMRIIMSKIYEEKNGENEIIIRTATVDDAKVLL